MGRLGILFCTGSMQIFAEFDGQEALVREFEDNLAKARAFVFGSYDVTERQAVELVLIHPVSGEWLPLKAEVVYIASGEPAAVGLEIIEWTPERAALIHSFVHVPSEDPISLVSPESLEKERLEFPDATPHVTAQIASRPPLASQLQPLDLSQPSPRDGLAEANCAQLDAGPEPGALAEEGDDESSATDESAEGVPSSRPTSSPPSSRSSSPPPKNVQERVRKLNLRERDAMARGGTLTERVALERAYGAVVWDGLLSNAALTGPEVARIAKNGNVTIPHLTLIVGNAAWLARAEVRRALLTNPRLTPPQIDRVLRALPPAELKILPKQTAYAPKVRAAAMKLLSR